jgi:hypothetical protein
MELEPTRRASQMTIRRLVGRRPVEEAGAGSMAVTIEPFRRNCGARARSLEGTGEDMPSVSPSSRPPGLSTQAASAAARDGPRIAATNPPLAPRPASRGCQNVSLAPAEIPKSATPLAPHPADFLRGQIQ